MSHAYTYRQLDDDETLQLADEIRRMPEDSFLAWDTETTGLSPYADDYMTGMSLCPIVRDTEWGEWSSGHWAMQFDGAYVPVGHKRGNVDPSSVRCLVDAMRTTKAKHILHHATFDWAVVKTSTGIDVRKPGSIDTQVVRWLQDENQPKGLKELGEILFDEDASKEKRELAEAKASWWANQTQAYKAVREAYPELPVKVARAMAREMRRDRDWGDLLPDEITPYACRDATLTADVADELEGLDQLLTPHDALQRELDLQPILFDMTDRGVSADHDMLADALTLYSGQAEKIAADAEEAYGMAWRQFKGQSAGQLNLNSTDQVAWLLFTHLGLPIMSETESGKPSTDKNALEQLQGHPVAGAVMEYRHLIKGAGSYAAAFTNYLEKSSDGRIHGMYDSTRTVTGRLSASNPNVMTIPKVGSLPEIRRAFHKTPPGITRYGFDIVSAELWVTLHFTGDPVLAGALLEGRSLHVETMKAIFGTDDKESRFYTLSKNVNYGAAYEAGPTQMAIYAAKAGYGPEEAKAIGRKAYYGHRDLFRVMHTMADRYADAARKRGKLPLISPGRYRHFRSPGVFVQYYTALNALVQSGVAEFMKNVMLELYRRGYGEYLILQVHDELVFDAPTGMGDELLRVIREITHDVNPFKYELQWDAHAWSDAA